LRDLLRARQIESATFAMALIFFQAFESGQLPQVSFYQPAGQLTEHPSYTDIASGDAHIADLLQKLEHSPQWPRMMIIVTYDENGGFWDHVPPPCGRLDPGIGVKPLTGSARFPICLEPNPRMN
jgi:phospholipase C